MAWHQLCDKPSSEPNLVPRIHITQPQWVNELLRKVTSPQLMRVDMADCCFPQTEVRQNDHHFAAEMFKFTLLFENFD